MKAHWYVNSGTGRQNFQRPGNAAKSCLTPHLLIMVLKSLLYLSKRDTPPALWIS